MKRTERGPAKRRPGYAGSLCGDIAQLAQTIHAASLQSDVVVWAEPNAELRFARSDSPPDVPEEFLAGTYGFGVAVADIEEDLRVLQSERVSSALIV